MELFPFTQAEGGEPMNISKFTQKSVQAVQDLEKVAYEYGNQEIEQEHLLYTLLTQEDSLILKLIEKMEINKDYFIDIVKKALDAKVKVSGGELRFGQYLNKALVNAEDEAKAMGDEYVSVEHLFLALLKYPSPSMKKIWSEFGITKERFLQALSTVRGNQRVVSDNPEATYDTLNKYGKKISIQKTEIYTKIEESKISLEAMGLNLKMKNEFDLFDYEVIYNGMLTQHNIENAYEIFMNQNYDLLDYLNYEEKRKMFDNDILPILKNAPSFYDEDSQTQIYIPYLEPFVNKRYTDDYQLMMLKQHQDYLKNYKVQQDLPIKLYGDYIFETNFSSLENVYEDERHVCLYYDQLKTIYIYRKDNKELLNKVIILDQECQATPDIADVKKIADYIETYQYNQCLDLLKEKNLICEKTYKKVLKKYK